jgi:hypothetical protein
MNDRRFYLAVGTIALGLLILAALLGTWLDEEYTLATTAHGPVYAFGRALSYELQAPLYFVLLAIWRVIDSSVFFARLFSVLCVLGFAFAAREIALRVRPGLPPLPFVVLAIANPFVVYAAMEIRLYALALLLSAVLWITFYDGYLSDERPRARVWFVILAIASAYVQYFLAFALVAGFFGLLIARRYQALRAFVVSSAIVAVAIAPVYWWVSSQTPAAYVAAASLRELLGSVIQPAMTFALPLAYDWTGPWYFLKLAHHAVEIVVLMFVFGFAAKRFSGREWAIAALPIVMWCIFFLAAAIMHLHYSLPRHFVGLYVPEIAALYVLVSRVAVDGHPRIALTIAALYAIFSAGTLVTTYRALAKPGDWPRIGAYLTSHARAGDRVAVFPARGLPALVRTYSGPAEVAAFPHAENYQRFDEHSAHLNSAAETETGLTNLARGHKVWLIITGACADAELDDGCVYLDDVLAREYPKAPVMTFYLSRVVEISGSPQQHL